MKRIKMLVTVLCTMLMLFGVMLDSVCADSITFNGSSGSLSASVKFETIGTNLIVTLTNTSSADVLVPSDLLTAVFFTLAGSPGSLLPSSAILAVGSSVLFGGTDPGGVVGGEWAFASDLSGAPGGATRGISSAGFGLFGAANFGGSNLQGPQSGAVDGMQYGITSAGDNSSTGNTPVTGENALIKNSVVFTLLGLTEGYLLEGKVSDVSFQYGTALTEPNVPPPPPPVPEPTTLLLLGLGLVGIAGIGRRLRK